MEILNTLLSLLYTLANPNRKTQKQKIQKVVYNTLPKKQPDQTADGKAKTSQQTHYTVVFAEFGEAYILGRQEFLFRSRK